MKIQFFADIEMILGCKVFLEFEIIIFGLKSYARLWHYPKCWKLELDLDCEFG